MKNKYLIMLAVAAILLIAAGCQNPPERRYNATATFEKYSLEWAVKAADDLDERYANEWRKEELSIKMVPLDTVNKIADEINAFRLEILNTGVNDSPALDFFGARLRMLESQKKFQLAKTLDPREMSELSTQIINGTVQNVLNVSDGFKCENKDNVKAANSYYTLSYSLGIDAINLMDRALQKGSDQAKWMIGTNDDRPMFYRSPLGRLSMTIKVNDFLINKYCAEKAGGTLPEQKLFKDNASLQTQ